MLRVLGLLCRILRLRVVVPTVTILLLILGVGTARAQTAQFGFVQSTIPATGLNDPTAVAVDSSGNIYIANTDAENVLKETPQSDGSYTQSTVASSLSNDFGVAVDSSGNVYIANSGINGQGSGGVLKETLQPDGSYTQSTIAGSLDSTTDVAVDSSGNLYIVNGGGLTNDGSVLKETLQPNGSYTQSTIPATGLNNPWGVAVDSSGNVYIVNEDDGNVLKETLSGGSYTQSTIVSGLSNSADVAVDGSGNVYIGNVGASAVLKETLQPDGSYIQNTIPATGLNNPYGVAVDGSGNLYIADALGGSGSGGILKLQTAEGENFYTEPVGTAGAAQTLTFTFDTGGYLNSTTPYQVVTQGATKDAQGNPLDFNAATTQASNVCKGSKDYAEGNTCTIAVTFKPTRAGTRYGALDLVSTSGTVIATAYLYGTGQGPQVAFSPPAQSTIPATGLDDPEGVAVDASGNVYIANAGGDNVLKETLSGGSYTQSTVATGLDSPTGVAVDGGGNIYIANDGGDNVLKETLQYDGSYTQSTIPATGLSNPHGVAVDGSGNVYIANAGGNSVLKETLSDGSYMQSTIVSGLDTPLGVAVDGSGNLYIANTSGNSLLKETLSGGSYTQSTIPATGLGYPWGVAVDGSGNVYVANNDGENVLKETLQSDGNYTQSTVADGLDGPDGAAVDGGGNVYIANIYGGSSGTGNVPKEDYADVPTLIFVTTTEDGTTDTTDGALSVQIENIGNEPLTAVSPGLSVSADFARIDGSGTPEDCTATFSLAANVSCNISVEFEPVAPASGTVNGSVVLTDNNLNASPSTKQTIPLVGTAVEAPTVTGISPNAGPAAGGTTVTITGMGFTGATTVDFGATPATSFTANSATQITAVAPAGSGVDDVTVTTGGGTSATTVADQFTYFAPSATNSILIANPIILPQGAGSTVTLTLKDTNSNLIPNTAVTFNLSETACTTNGGITNCATLTPTTSTSTNASGVATLAVAYTNGFNSATVTATSGGVTIGPVTITWVAPAYVVTKAMDDATGVAGNCVDPNVSTTGNANCSLRDALAAANAIGGAAITFDPTVFTNATTITPGSGGTLTIPTNTSITGPTSGSGAALTNLVTVSGVSNGANAIFTVNSGASNAAIANLTLTAGDYASFLGGAIFNQGTLTVSNSTFSSNSAINGGAIFNSSGTLTVINSTFTNNTAGAGAAIWSNGTLSVTNSTFSDNSAGGGDGGAIFFSSGTLSVNNSTFSGNSASVAGAIYSYGTPTVVNSILSGDTGGECGGSGCPTTGSNGNVVGVPANLSALGNYGGPTQTFLPLPGSAAICSGVSVTPALTTDQRGDPRPTTYGVTPNTTVCVDAGAVQTNYALVFTASPTGTIIAGQPLTPTPVVAVTESGKPLTAGSTSVVMSAANGTLNGTTTEVTSTTAGATAGTATFSGLSITTPETNDTLTATLSLNPALTPALSLMANSSTFDIIAGTPTAGNSSFTLPSPAVAGTTVTGALTLKDQDGNLVQPTSVTFSTTSTTTSFSTPTTVTTSNGVASISFSDTKAETVTIVVSVGGTPFLTGTVQITPAAPASVAVVSGTPQSATVNTQFAAPLVVVIEDKYGNPTPNVAVPPFVAPSTGASATLSTVADTNSSGQASVTATANSTSGSYNVTVTEQGTTATFALTNNAATQTITFPQPATPVTYGIAPITLTATSNSQLAVDYTVTGPATVNGSTLTITGAGTVTITASQTGNSEYAAATPMIRTVVVNKQPSMMVLSASPTSITPAQSTTLTATVSATVAGTPLVPGGSVTFMNNGTALSTVSLANGTAQLVTELPPGATSVITVAYSGDGNFLTSTSTNNATVVVAPLDFTFTDTGASAYTAAPGAVASYSFALAPLYGSYAAPVNFTVTGLPVGATASFTPSTIAASASGATPVVMAVQTASAIAHNHQNSPFGRSVVLALLLLPFGMKRSLRKKLNCRMLWLLLLLAGTTAAVSGCGSNNGFLLQSPQTYTLTVTTTAGTLSHSQTVTLIVQ